MADPSSAPLRSKRARWIWVSLLVTLVTAGGVAAVQVGTQLEEREATALLWLARRPPRLLEITVPAPPEDRADRDEYCHTQTALARSRLVLCSALRKDEVATLPILKELADPVDWLERNVKVSFPDSPQVMQISLRASRHTDDLVVLVNAITQAYQQEIVERETIHRRDRLQRLKEISSTFEKNVQELRKVMQLRQVMVGPGDKEILASKVEQHRAEYEDARAELMRTRRELRRLRVQAAALERGGPKGSTESEHKAKQLKLREEIDFLQELEKQLVLDMERLARDCNQGFIKESPELPAQQRELERQEEVLKIIAKEVSLLRIEIEAGSRLIAVLPAVLRKTRLQ
jgi:hypothetical protein